MADILKKDGTGDIDDNNQIADISHITGAHSKESSGLFNVFKTDPQNGLSKDGAVAALALYGLNSLTEKPKRPFILKFLDQFKDFMVLVLIAASTVSGLLGEWIDAIVIIAIVLINAVLGVVQEGKAEKAIEALKKMSSPSAKVIRGGVLTVVPSSEVVPGDICIIEAGDIVPADMRLTSSSSLKIEEASLTGESVPVEKDASLLIDAAAPLGDRINMCYMNTSVTYGRGRGLVIATGGRTEIGKIAEKLEEITEEATPLQKNLNKLGKILGIICLAVCAVVFAYVVLSGGDPLDAFMTAISLAVAAIPEGLPAVVTIVLALGMKRMADKNAIMKQLLAVETLGSVDVICSDKTGTLTQNEMTVTVAWVHDRSYSIGGTGYGYEGTVSIDGEDIKVSGSGTMPHDRLFQNCILCTDAELRTEGDSNTLIGDPTEGSIIVAAAKAGLDITGFRSQNPRKGELPFDSIRKMMTTYHDDPSGSGRLISFTKGAPDIIINNCSQILTDSGIIPLAESEKTLIMERNSAFASGALRVLAFALKNDPAPDSFEAEKSMTFIGLAGMIDPERPEAKAAIAVCKEAGIIPVMITGDYKDTAVAIADNLGLSRADHGVMTGSELDIASDDEMRQIVERTTVYARVSPEHKVRIITALRENGHVAAMTGDGVNDAMALKRADIGVAMGITGTEVAKNTANMILTDDNFATIVVAVEEGRIIYENIRKFVGFLLSCNVGEILVVFVTSIVLGPKFIPLLPIQLLWLNLVTDSFPALALGREKGEPDVMKRKPRDPNENIINKPMLRMIITQSLAIFTAVFVAFKIGIALYPAGAEPSEHARTFAFVTLICAELFRAFSARSEHTSIFRIGLFSNKNMNYSILLSFVLVIAVIYIPFMQPIFKTTALGWTDWAIVGGLALFPFIVGELVKFITSFTKKHASGK